MDANTAPPLVVPREFLSAARDRRRDEVYRNPNLGESAGIIAHARDLLLIAAIVDTVYSYKDGGAVCDLIYDLEHIEGWPKP